MTHANLFGVFFPFVVIFFFNSKCYLKRWLEKVCSFCFESSYNLHVWLIGDSKFTVCESKHESLSFCVGPLINRQSTQGLPRLLLYDSWNILLQPWIE